MRTSDSGESYIPILGISKFVAERLDREGLTSARAMRKKNDTGYAPTTAMKLRIPRFGLVRNKSIGSSPKYRYAEF
jgi:hypothetical protein